MYLFLKASCPFPGVEDENLLAGSQPPGPWLSILSKLVLVLAASNLGVKDYAKQMVHPCIGCSG